MGRWVLLDLSQAIERPTRYRALNRGLERIQHSANRAQDLLVIDHPNFDGAELAPAFDHSRLGIQPLALRLP